jgi:hypothetical protein
MVAVLSCLALNLLLVVTFVWHDEDMAGGGEGPLAVTAFSHREGWSSHPVSSVKDVDWVQTTRRRPGMATGGVVDIYGWVRRVSSYPIVSIHARPRGWRREGDVPFDEGLGGVTRMSRIGLFCGPTCGALSHLFYLLGFLLFTQLVMFDKATPASCQCEYSV